MSVDDTLKSIYAWRRDLFDELLVEKFIQCVGIYPLGSVVELRTGQVGIVISSRPDARLFPKIMLIRDAHREPVEPPKMINLALFKEKLDTDDFEIRRLVEGHHHGIDVRPAAIRVGQRSLGRLAYEAGHRELEALRVVFRLPDSDDCRQFCHD